MDLFSVSKMDDQLGAYRMIQMVKMLYAFNASMWKSRNEILHSTDSQSMAEIRSTENAEIRYLFTNPDLLAFNDRHLCAGSLDSLLQGSAPTRRRWLRRAKLSSENARQDSARQSLITSFFVRPGETWLTPLKHNQFNLAVRRRVGYTILASRPEYGDNPIISLNLFTGGVAWVGEAWVLANIVHAIAKKGLSWNSSAMKIMQLLGYDETGKWLFDHQKNPQNIATVFARVASLLKSIYQIWFKCSTSVGNGSLTPARQPQNIAQCVWAYGGSKLRIKLSNLFWLLEERTEWMVYKQW